jgi:hypothetical protein
MMPADPKSRDQANGVDDLSYVKAAFRSQYNLIGLGGLVAFALVSASALPLILGAGLELIYLASVPQMSRFQRLVRSRRYEAEKQARDKSLAAMYQELPVEMRVRYAKLDKICQTIRQNYSALSSTSQMFTDQMESKLQGLSQSYVRLLNAAFHHREYLQQTNPEQIRHECGQLESAVGSQAPKVQEINRKRIEILHKRMEKYNKVGENCQVIDAQCAAIEDVLQLIRDQSVTMHDPQQISDHLDSLVKDVEQTEETVREVESIFDIAPLATPDFDDEPAPRNRVRT